MSILGFSCTVLITWEGILMFVRTVKVRIECKSYLTSYSVSTQSLLKYVFPYILS
jgi:hypothetical protein